MEDWAYSASWENNATDLIKPIKICNPNSYGGYAKEKTIYDSVSIRPMVYLIECYYKKRPKEITLGNNNTYVFNEGNLYYIKIKQNKIKNINRILFYLIFSYFSLF
jgi:hypothetical protein